MKIPGPNDNLNDESVVENENDNPVKSAAQWIEEFQQKVRDDDNMALGNVICQIMAVRILADAAGNRSNLNTKMLSKKAIDNFVEALSGQPEFENFERDFRRNYDPKALQRLWRLVRQKQNRLFQSEKSAVFGQCF